MRKLGLIGRWALMPAAGLSFTLNKARMVQFEVNTTEKTVFVLDDLPGLHNLGEVKPPALLGAVEGLETFEFRVSGPFRISAVQADPEAPSQVWYATEEGLNFAIDGEHLRDYTVPMIGRRERNEEMDRLRFEMRQEMRQQQAFFKEFMQFQEARAQQGAKQKEPENGEGDEAQGDAEGKSGNTKSGAGGSGNNRNDRSSAKVDPKRAVPKNGNVQQSADEGDKDGGAPEDT